MSTNELLLTLNLPFEQSLEWVYEQLTARGLSTVRTFDLQHARRLHPFSACPRHGGRPCDCQMAVLLIYQGDIQPASLVAHSQNGRTRLYLVDTPVQRADPALESAIQLAFNPGFNVFCSSEKKSGR